MQSSPGVTRLGRARAIAVRLAPWVIAVGVTAVVLQQYSYRDILQQMKAGDTLAMLPFALIGPVIYMAIVSLADTLILRAVGPLTYPRVFGGKSATAALAALSYSLGAGAYGLWIARRAEVNAKTASGALLYIMWSDLTSVCAVGSIAMWIAEVDIPRSVVIIASAVAVFQPLMIAVGIPDIFVVFPKLSRGAAYGQLGVRVLGISASALTHWLGAVVFGLNIPFDVAAVHMPIVLSAQALPINVGGFGAVQGVWLLSFSKLVPGEQILAFQILWQALLGISMILRGLPFLRRVTREIAKDRKKDLD